MIRVAILWAVMTSLVVAGDGPVIQVLSLENRPKCINGVCYTQPGIRAGAGSCVPVARTRDGSTVCLTAAHCIDARSDQFVVAQNGRSFAARVVYSNRKCDLAAVVCPQRFSISTIARRPRQGSRITLAGVLSRRFQTARGVFVGGTEHEMKFADLWSHSGMSGGGVFDENDRLVSIFHSKLVNGSTSYGCGERCISHALSVVQQRLGPVVFGKDLEPPPSSSSKPDRQQTPDPQVEALKKQIAALAKQLAQKGEPADVDEALKRLADKYKNDASGLRAELEAVAKKYQQLKQRADELEKTAAAVKPTQTETPVEKTPAAELEEPVKATPAAKPWYSGIVEQWGSVAVSAGTLLAPQYAIPITIGAGLVGAWWKRRRKGERPVRNDRTSTAAPPPPVPSPDEAELRIQPPGQSPGEFLSGLGPEITRYRPTPVDVEGRLLRAAMRKVADNYPGAAPFVNIVEDTARIIKSGERP